MIKIGALNFINAFPLFHALQEKLIPNNVSIQWGNPVEINSLLSRGEVDIAMISSGDFLKNRYSYILLSDLGIAATEQVMSIRLFFKGKSPILDQSKVLVPTLTATSSHLLKTICANFWKVEPCFSEFSCTPCQLFSQESPFLLIGDSCLEYYHCTSHNSIDMAKAWNEATRKSFIFAVIATRNDAFARFPQEVIEFHRLLEQSYQWALKNMGVIVQKAKDKTHCSEPFLHTYFNTIEYRLMSKHFHGLDYFAGLGVK